MILTSGEFEKSIYFMEQMKSKFEELDEKQKDKHIRKKLTKCTYALSKISKCEKQEYRNRASIMQDWIDAESVS